MNKKRNAVVIFIIFVFQLLIPLGMVAYTSYINWGLENKASVYNFPLAAVEWQNPKSVYLQFEFTLEGTMKGTYCSVKTGYDGYASTDIIKKRPQGNYIRSVNARWFYLPLKVRSYEPKLDISENEYRWLYFVPDEQKEEWGWRQTENYFEVAYAEVHIFRGHAVTKAVYIDGQTIEDHISKCITIDLRNDY